MIVRGMLPAEATVMLVAIRSDLANFKSDTALMPRLAWLRRGVVATLGFTVLFIGVAMVILPGPAVVVIPLGLAILATEFLWARRLLERAHATLARSGKDRYSK